MIMSLSEKQGPGGGIARVGCGYLQTLFGLLVVNISQISAAQAHGVFHIFTPVVEQGEWGAEALSAFQFGVPAGDAHDDDGLIGHEDENGTDGHAHDALKRAHEFAIHGGITSFWMAKVALSAEKIEGESYDLSSVAFENVFRLPEASRGPLDWGWYTAIGVGTNSEETNAVEFGPVVSLSSGLMTLTLNPFFEKTFGRNREDGIALSYGWRATYEIEENFSVGVEGYGEIADIGNAPGASEQIHRIGPVLYLGHVHGNPSHHEMHEGEHHGDEHGGHEGGLHAEVGVLFGLTQATPDAALKVNLGLDF